MRAVVVPQPGGPEALRLVELEDPAPAAGELLVAVAATAVNRADLLQREGRYPPPPGASEVLGLELSGTVAAVGDGVEGWAVGDELCAVVPGGAYATLAVVTAATAMALPPGVGLVEAAAVPEVFTTAWDNVWTRGRLRAGESLLVHGGASGVGTAAIQLARWRGSPVWVTAGSRERVAACVALGAEGGVDYREREDFDVALRELTRGAGFDVVLDMVGAAYFERNLRCLADDGRLVVIGLQGGSRTEIELGTLLGKRLSVLGSTLRARGLEARAALARTMVTSVWPGFAEGALHPVIDRVLPLDEVAEAHRVVAASEHVGKVVLQVWGADPR